MRHRHEIDVTRIVWWDGFVRRRIADVIALGWFGLATTATVRHVVAGGHLRIIEAPLILAYTLTLAPWLIVASASWTLGRRPRVDLSTLLTAMVSVPLVIASMATYMRLSEGPTAFNALVVTTVLVGASGAIGLRRRWLVRNARVVGPTSLQ